MIELQRGDRTCLYASTYGDCPRPTIRAHSISRNAGLSRIARKGHVYQPNGNPFRLLKDSGQITHQLVGIGDATTFTGFCSEHDALVFKPIDQGELTPTPEQGFLLHYRALCRELYVKRAALPTNELMRDADRGRPIHVQRNIQEFVAARNLGIQAALRELEQEKAVCDKMLLAKDFGNFCGCAIYFDSTPTLACAGLTQPMYDFTGSVLQKMSDVAKPLSELSFTLLPTETGGLGMFGWLKDSDAVCRRFVISFLSLPDERKTDAIVQFIFDSFENHVAQPDWWEAIPDGLKNELYLRLMNWTDMLPVDTAALIPGRATYAHWKPMRTTWL